MRHRPDQMERQALIGSDDPTWIEDVVRVEDRFDSLKRGIKPGILSWKKPGTKQPDSVFAVTRAAA